MAVPCPDCGARTRVTRTVGARRRRCCVGCGCRFTTFEELAGRPARADQPAWIQELPTEDELVEIIRTMYPASQL